MIPVIKTIEQKKLVGTRLRMSLLENRTAELWRSFMPLRNQIHHRLSSDLISLQIYDPLYFQNFNPAREFEKWSVVEVAEFVNIPDGMETMVLPGGMMYAVFHYQGLSSNPEVFQYIFSDWLPKSDYLLDDRPHFEVLGAKYKNNDPSSEEEIWIPVKAKR